MEKIKELRFTKPPIPLGTKVPSFLGGETL